MPYRTLHLSWDELIVSGCSHCYGARDTCAVSMGGLWADVRLCSAYTKPRWLISLWIDHKYGCCRWRNSNQSASSCHVRCCTWIKDKAVCCWNGAAETRYCEKRIHSSFYDDLLPAGNANKCWNLNHPLWWTMSDDLWNGDYIDNSIVRRRSMMRIVTSRVCDVWVSSLFLHKQKQT